MSSASLQQQQQQHPSATSSSAVTVGVKRSLQHASPVTCQLVDAELWRRFHEVGNEMIVTKAGRRMFPVIACTVSGLDPDALYSVCVEFHPADDNRYKYVGGQWVIAAKSQLHDVPVPTYFHPEVPNFGQHWANNVVSFGKLKLTNKDKLDKSQVSLVTLHLYQPVIRIIRVTGQQERFTVATFTFPETRFMAVTSYQNEDVTSLKVRYNPFAQKVFQDMAKGRSGGSSNGQDDDGDDEPNLSPPSAIDPRPSAGSASKMMKSGSGIAIATSTASAMSYNSSRVQSQISPTHQSSARQGSQAPQRPVPCQPASLLDQSYLGNGADFSSFMQPSRYGGAFTPVQQPMFDQLGTADCFQFSSMYTNPTAFTNSYNAANPACFTNPPMATSLPPATTNAAAAAAAYASYSSSLLSSTLPPVAHTNWPGFNLYPASSGVPTFNTSTLSALTKGREAQSLLNAGLTTPSTPSGPSSTTASNTSGNRSSAAMSLMQLGSSGNGSKTASGSASSTTPTLQSLGSGLQSEVASAPAGSVVVKASPPESGYCGSPVSEEWTNCAYQQMGNSASQVILSSVNSSSATSTNNAAY